MTTGSLLYPVESRSGNAMPAVDDSQDWVPGRASVARDFGSASPSYDHAARLQRHMGNELMSRSALALDAEPDRILDLGCGTGFFAAQLHSSYSPADVVGMDLSPAMIRYARAHRPASIRWMMADAESLPFADASFDLVFSNLMIQWCVDPRPVLEECLRVLQPGGVLACSTLLDGTLRELDTAWQAVDPGNRHVNRFEPVDVLENKVREVFPGACMVTEAVILPYESPLTLLGELKALGATYKGRGRRKTVTAPGRLRRLSRHYPKAPAGGITATYEAAYLLCCRQTD